MRVATLDESLRSTGLNSSSRQGSTTKSSVASLDRLVQFNEIQIREYERTVGDNPSVTKGPPVSIGWNYKEKESKPLEEYENTREERKNISNLVLSKRIRTEIILESGVSRKEMAAVVRQTNAAKNKRRTTVNNIGTITRAEELWESALRKVNRFVRRKKRDSVEYENWKAEFEKAARIVEAKNQAKMEQYKAEHAGAERPSFEFVEPAAVDLPPTNIIPPLKECLSNISDEEVAEVHEDRTHLRKITHRIEAEE